MTKLESSVQSDIIKALKRKGCYVLNIVGGGYTPKGTNDIVCCYKGHYITFEAKRDLDGSYGVTKTQEIRMRQVRKAGGLTFAVDSPAGALAALESIPKG